MIFVAIACICNIAGDLLLVAGFGMGPAGAALATILSQGLSALMAVLYLKHRKFRFDFQAFELPDLLAETENPSDTRIADVASDVAYHSLVHVHYGDRKSNGRGFWPLPE